MTALTQSFTAALAANRLLQPANDSAKALSARADQHRRRQSGGGHGAPESGQRLSARAAQRARRAAISPPPTPGCNEARTIGFTARELDGRRSASWRPRARTAAQRDRGRRRELAASASNTSRRNSRPSTRNRGSRRLGGAGIHGAHRRLDRRHRRDQLEPAQDFRQLPPSRAVEPVALQARRCATASPSISAPPCASGSRTSRWTRPAHNAS